MHEPARNRDDAILPSRTYCHFAVARHGQRPAFFEKDFRRVGYVSLIRRGRLGLELRGDGPHVHETKQQ